MGMANNNKNVNTANRKRPVDKRYTNNPNKINIRSTLNKTRKGFKLAVFLGLLFFLLFAATGNNNDKAVMKMVPYNQVPYTGPAVLTASNINSIFIFFQDLTIIPKS
jgi:hypothetical protein